MKRVPRLDTVGLRVKVRHMLDTVGLRDEGVQARASERRWEPQASTGEDRC